MFDLACVLCERLRLAERMKFINEYFLRSRVAPEQMDALWAHGWRHFGAYFFRYSVAPGEDALRHVLPLRLEVARFQPSRSQRRVLAKNEDVRVEICDTTLDAAKHTMFRRHRQRFRENVPGTLYDFLSEDPAREPCRNQAIEVYAGERLIAASFLDIGQTATSAVYAMFEPDEARRSLGIFTMLQAIEYTRRLGFRYYYPGYAYREPSIYDYKKRFAPLEYFNWETGWRAMDA